MTILLFTSVKITARNRSGSRKISFNRNIFASTRVKSNFSFMEYFAIKELKICVIKIYTKLLEIGDESTDGFGIIFDRCRHKMAISNVTSC